MLAISSRSPRARALIDTASQLAAQLHATWFVVHVRQPPVLHYRMATTKNPVPQADLDYARKLGGRAIIESGDLSKTLVLFARKMSIDYFVTGRSFRSRFSLAWELPLTEVIQRKLPTAMVIII